MYKPALCTQISSYGQPAPKWLSQQELERLIMQEAKEYRAINSIYTKTEQLTQSTLRVEAHAKMAANPPSRIFNFLVKSALVNNDAALKFARAYSFEVEWHMQEVVLPALVQLYNDVDECQVFSAAILKPKLALKTESPNCLYLESLQASRGYRVANQTKGLDKPNMHMILTKLAAYHAATACYLQLQPAALKELPKLDHQSHQKDEFLAELQLRFYESLRANNLGHYEDKIKSFQESLLSGPEPTDFKKCFNVILNGACWPNNLLCNINAFGHIKDLRFNDFGYATYGPAIYDVLQLLLTAPADKTLEFDGYLRYYTDQLTAQLQKLNFKGKLPTLSDFQVDILNSAHWCFEIVTEILPIVQTNCDSVSVLDIFKSSEYSTDIQQLLPWLENRGYLEQ